MPDPDKKPRGTFDTGDAVFAEMAKLHERIADVDPDLVVTLAFGSRTNAPKRLGGLGEDKIPSDKSLGDDKADTFRNYWSDEGTGGFGNVFDKFGDGFINVHTLAE